MACSHVPPWRIKELDTLTSEGPHPSKQTYQQSKFGSLHVGARPGEGQCVPALSLVGKHPQRCRKLPENKNVWDDKEHTFCLAWQDTAAEWGIWLCLLPVSSAGKGPGLHS